MRQKDRRRTSHEDRGGVMHPPASRLQLPDAKKRGGMVPRGVRGSMALLEP